MVTQVPVVAVAAVEASALVPLDLEMGNG